MASCSTCGFIPRYRRKLRRKDLLSSRSPWNSFGGLPPNFPVSAGGPAGAPPPPAGIPPPPPPPIGMGWTVRPMVVGAVVVVCAWVLVMAYGAKSCGVGVTFFPLLVGSSVSANSPSDESTSMPCAGLLLYGPRPYSRGAGSVVYQLLTLSS